MSHWFLAQIKPNADDIAKRNLERQGFFTFQPLERCTRVRGGRFSTYHRSFFPGYMFVSFSDALAPWPKVNATYGVARLVNFAGRPSRVPASIVAELQDSCGEDGILAIDHRLGVGSQVEVSNGAFADFMGEIERVTPDHRALVLIDFMGKRTRVSLQASSLRPVRGAERHKAAAA